MRNFVHPTAKILLASLILGGALAASAHRVAADPEFALDPMSPTLAVRLRSAEPAGAKARG